MRSEETQNWIQRIKLYYSKLLLNLPKPFGSNSSVGTIAIKKATFKKRKLQVQQLMLRITLETKMSENLEMELVDNAITCLAARYKKLLKYHLNLLANKTKQEASQWSD